MTYTQNELLQWLITIKQCLGVCSRTSFIMMAKSVSCWNTVQTIKTGSSHVALPGQEPCYINLCQFSYLFQPSAKITWLCYSIPFLLLENIYLPHIITHFQPVLFSCLCLLKKKWYFTKHTVFLVYGFNQP